MTIFRHLSLWLILVCLVLSACDDSPDYQEQINKPTSTILPTVSGVKNRPANAVVITLDPAKIGAAISPYIYGLGGTDEKDPDYASKLGITLMRWGGNPSTRFNWVRGNAWNAGRDWEFRNGDYGNPNRDVATEAVSGTLKHKAAMLLTIPTIGWVAKDTNNETRSLNVPSWGGAPLAGSDAIAGYDPANNRALTSVQSLPRKNAPFVTQPDPNSPVIYQDEWVASLVQKFGTAQNGGVKFYAMDNEPELWSQTHTDVHPAQMSYDDLLSRFTEYAAAVKDVDPTAQITGPVSAGWQAYFYSELDRGSNNFKTPNDRAAHGNQPFIPWFLQQLKAYEQKNSRRLLDVLDIHFYPQGQDVYAGKTDATTNALRLRSTRGLWDAKYRDESWINTQIQLIPRMRDWINTYYPGTKLGITEWNWGADDTLNGALAIGQVLGIYGREGVYLAAYYSNPPAGSPGFEAFRLYTNFDNKGSRFGDISLPLTLSDDRNVSGFAALDSTTGRLRLILINQQPTTAQNISLELAQSLPAQTANVYQISADTGNKIAAQPGLKVETTNQVTLTLPAYSMTLLDLQPPSK